MSGRLWRLQVPDQPIRGAYVSLGEDWAALVAERGYSDAAARLLGQAMVAMPLLSVHLKTRARVSLQITQAAPLNLLTVQGSTEGQVRGMIKLEGSEVDPAGLDGQLVVTLEPEKSSQKFQGIVPLEGAGPAAWLARYFEQSEQVPTRLILCADRERAEGIILQAMPGQDAGELDWVAAMDAMDVDALPEQPGEWLSTMLGFDLQMSAEASEVVLACGCSPATVSGMLLSLGRQELSEVLADQGRIEVECGFCGQMYRFDEPQVNALFVDGDAPSRLN